MSVSRDVSCDSMFLTNKMERKKEGKGGEREEGKQKRKQAGHYIWAGNNNGDTDVITNPQNCVNPEPLS